MLTVNCLRRVVFGCVFEGTPTYWERFGARCGSRVLAPTTPPVLGRASGDPDESVTGFPGIVAATVERHTACAYDLIPSGRLPMPEEIVTIDAICQSRSQYRLTFRSSNTTSKDRRVDSAMARAWGSTDRLPFPCDGVDHRRTRRGMALHE